MEYRKQATEEGQPRAAGIIDICRRVLFLQAEEINWDADVWYLERLCLQPERMDPSNPVVSLSFSEVIHGGNRKLLKKYMQYGLGLTDLSLRYLRGEFIEIRSFLKELQQDACTMTEDEIRDYIQGLQEQHWRMKQGRPGTGCPGRYWNVWTDGRQNMSKYDRMIALNKQASEEKIEKARREIVRMVDDGEKVSVQKLMQRTGLSRGFFYKNPAVRKEIDRALEQQAGIVDPRREVMDMAMNNELAMLHKQVDELKAENERLRQELAATKKALAKKNVGVLKKMM